MPFVEQRTNDKQEEEQSRINRADGHILLDDLPQQECKYQGIDWMFHLQSVYQQYIQREHPSHTFPCKCRHRYFSPADDCPFCPPTVR